jgi:hypothetical protein
MTEALPGGQGLRRTERRRYLFLRLFAVAFLRVVFLAAALRFGLRAAVVFFFAVFRFAGLRAAVFFAALRLLAGIYLLTPSPYLS